MKKLFSLFAAILFAGAMWAANAKVDDVLWSEDFSGFSDGANPSGTYSSSVSHTGTVVYSGSITYAVAKGTDSQPKVATEASGATGLNLLLYKKNSTFTVSNIPTGGATEVTLAYYKGGTGTLAITGSDNISISGSTITINSGTSFNLTFKNTNSSNNLRLDGLSVVVKTAGADCDNNVTVSAGTPSNGTFSLNKSGELATCAGAVEVVVTPSPALHYKATGCSASNSSNISDLTDGKYTVTYAQNTNASSTINVTFTIKNQYTVTWTNNGVQSDPVSVYDEEQPTFPTPNPTSCDATSTTFVGWSTGTWNGKVANLAGKTVYYNEDELPVINGENVEYFAVFTKAGSESAVSGGDISEYVPTSWTRSGTDKYSDHGAKFDSEGDYIQSPDLSENNYKDVTVKFKSGYNGNEGSVLTIATLDADENVIASKEITPTDEWTSQTTTYSAYLAGNKTIKYVRITMTSKTSNLAMEYCKVFNTPKEDYMTNCTAAGTCETPQFSIVGDTYNTAQSVTLSCATEGATIYYTTDGTDPDNGSIEYTSSAIAVNTNMTIKAIAIKDGLTDSDIAEETFTFETSTPTITGDPAAIISGNYFVDAIEVTLAKTGEGTIYYTTDGKNPATDGKIYNEPFTLELTTTVKAIVIREPWTSGVMAEKEFVRFAVENCATARIAALSVSANNELYNDGETFTIRGYVTDLTKFSSSNYFWIADATDGGNVLEVYKPTQKGTGTLALGNPVEVVGKLTKYNTTPEFAEGCTYEILDDITTAIDNTEISNKAVKFIQNGQLFIELNGHIYNAQGQVVK